MLRTLYTGGQLLATARVPRLGFSPVAVGTVARTCCREDTTRRPPSNVLRQQSWAVDCSSCSSSVHTCADSALPAGVCGRGHVRRRCMFSLIHAQ